MECKKWLLFLQRKFWNYQSHTITLPFCRVYGNWLEPGLNQRMHAFTLFSHYGLLWSKRNQKTGQTWMRSVSSSDIAEVVARRVLPLFNNWSSLEIQRLRRLAPNSAMFYLILQLLDLFAVFLLPLYSGKYFLLITLGGLGPSLSI